MAGDGNITVWINSPGGDCVAAAQIYNMLMDYPHDVTVKIDGIAASSRSENLGTTPRLGTFPDSLTKLPAICLHMFSNFANIAYKLCIRYLSIKCLISFNLLNINNMHNFLNINLL